MKLRLLLFICIGGLLSTWLAVTTGADQYFDSYGSIPWKEEQPRLDNFARFLDRNPDTIGYIAFYVGKHENSEQTLKRANRAKNYVVNDRKIDKDRIVVINAGDRDETKFVLQPTQKGVPPPF